MKITYYGHSCFGIQHKGFHFVIDPYISGNAICPICVDDIQDVTHVLVTHGHGDHFGDAIELARLHDALIICNYEIAHYVRPLYKNVRAMHVGGRSEFDFGRLKMTNATHGSDILDPVSHELICGGSACGFIIELSDYKVYHAGDTGVMMDMQLLKRENIDIAMVPIGGNFTMDIEDAILAVEFISPKIAIPMHYKTFDVIDVEPDDFKSGVKNCQVDIYELGETKEYY